MEPVRELARDLKDEQRVLFLGRHVGYPMALEGALKLKELAYISAEGYPAGEIKHGPIALVEDGRPGRGHRAPARPAAKLINNVQEVRARGARTIVIATDGDDSLKPYADSLILLPDTKSLLSPLLTLVPMQVLSAEIARARGPGRRPAAQPGQVGHGRVVRRHRAAVAHCPMRSRLLVTGSAAPGPPACSSRSAPGGDLRRGHARSPRARAGSASARCTSAPG
jgi:fructoselysine-6-P-deglycase FrlB-like protein